MNQAVNLASNGLLYPTLFQSQEWLRTIDMEQLNKMNAKFPLSGKEFSHINIAKISDIKIAINKNYLVYFIHLPLTDFNSMSLYKITPFAAINKLGNDSMTAYIIPKNNYLSISQDKKSYIAPSLEKIQKCKGIGDKRLR